MTLWDKRIDNIIWTDVQKELTHAAGSSTSRERIWGKQRVTDIWPVFLWHHLAMFSQYTCVRVCVCVCVFLCVWLSTLQSFASTLSTWVCYTRKHVSLATMESVAWYLINTFKNVGGGGGGCCVWERTKTWNQYSAWQRSLTTRLFTVAEGWEGRYSHIHHSGPRPDKGRQ